MSKNTQVANLKKRSFVFAVIVIIFALINIFVGFVGEVQVRNLNTILSIIVIIAGMVILAVRENDDLDKIGMKIVWAGWAVFPASLAGILLMSSPFYSAGLGKGFHTLSIVCYLINSILGLWLIVYSHNKTEVPMAP